MAVLIGHLLKWKYQPERQSASWDKTIKPQRKEPAYALDESPRLRGALIINPTTARSAPSAVRTADPTGHGVTVESAVRTVRGRPER